MARGKRQREIPIEEALNDVYLESSLRPKNKHKRRLEKMPIVSSQNFNQPTTSSQFRPDPQPLTEYGFEDLGIVEHDISDWGKLPVRSKVFYL